MRGATVQPERSTLPAQSSASPSWPRPRATSRRGPGRARSLPIDVYLDDLRPLLREARNLLGVDAVTVAIQHEGTERLLVCTTDGEVREAVGSLFLGYASAGATRLPGALGILQAAEGAHFFGFRPTACFAARFDDRRRKLSGSLAAWTRRPRRWAAVDGSLLRRMARLCRGRLEDPAAT